MEVLTNLVHSLRQHPRVVYLLYYNPLQEHVVAKHPAFHRIGGTHQYSMFRTAVQAGTDAQSM
jgi:hypothetical protein